MPTPLVSPIGTFADRTTYVVFGDYLPGTLQPWVSIQRDADQMCHSNAAVISDAILAPRIGWQIASYQLDPGSATWLTAAQSGVLTPAAGNASAGSYMFEAPAFTQETIPGMSYGSGVQTTGAPYLTARYPTSETNWGNNAMSSDQAAFPGPNPSEDLVPLDRVLVSSTSAVNPWDDITFLFIAPGSAISPRSTLANLYFMGPAGSDQAAVNDSGLLGTGDYCAKIRGDGKAYVYELLNNQTWKKRFSFPWRYNANAVSWGVERICVKSRMWQDAHENYQGDRITFNQAGWTVTPGHYGTIDAMVGLAHAAIKTATGDVPTYNVPRLSDQPTTKVPIRVDLARDCRASIQVSRHIYYASATIRDDYLCFQHAITTDEPIYVYLSGVLPSGTSWNVKAYDENGTMLAVNSGLTTTNTKTGQVATISFVPTTISGVGQRYIQLEFTLNSNSDFSQTPTITGYEVDRTVVYAGASPVTPVTIPSARGSLPALLKNAVESITITPQQADPGAESATVVVADYLNELQYIQEVNRLPIAIWTTYDSHGNVACLFRGYIRTASRKIHRSSPFQVYPATDWSEYTLQCDGEWSRAAQVRVPNFRTWTNPVTGQPFKATDVIRICASTIYPSWMVDVPDLDVQLFSADGDAYVAEFGTQMIDIMSEMCADFTGGYMLFDEAAS